MKNDIKPFPNVPKYNTETDVDLKIKGDDRPLMRKILDFQNKIFSEQKKLKCIKSVDNPFKFTKGKEYWFTYVSDPEGWATVDDNGQREVFFNTDKLFK